MHTRGDGFARTGPSALKGKMKVCRKKVRVCLCKLVNAREYHFVEFFCRKVLYMESVSYAENENDGKRSFG